MIQSWYLLGPVTRFQNVGEHHDYEVAQQPIYAVRTSGDTVNPTAEELKVFHVETVRGPNICYSCLLICWLYVGQGSAQSCHSHRLALLDHCRRCP